MFLSAATSCAACHTLARCHAPLADDSAQSVSCHCEGDAVGDGFTCYNQTTCSGDDCCPQGYRWSPAHGCVDVDECSRSPCGDGQVCANAAGSFTCLIPAGFRGAKPRPRSVRFGCGGAQCPLGQDCVQVNGTAQCADPCQHHAPLQDAWRSTDFAASPEATLCDARSRWQGWYRLFIGDSGVQMPERCIERRRCGTDAPLWLRSPHPLRTEGIIRAEVCGSWERGCCHFQSDPIHVKACPGNFYVYRLVTPPLCGLAYCAGEKHVCTPAPQTFVQFQGLNCSAPSGNDNYDF